jgi:hypothetical protein
MTSIRLPLVDRHPLWTTAQWIGVVATVVLLAALGRWPVPTLHILWEMVIPLLPAVFLVNPMLWRNVCPLASLNTLTGARRPDGALGVPALVGLWGGGIALLAVLVPARRFLFNENGLVMAVTVAGVGLLALVMGTIVSRRGGFCNALCPVLPVEKLYGQAPLLRVGSARCHDCNQCTAAGCIDLAGGKSSRQSVRNGEGLAWLRSPFGLFAAGFPGFVVGYFQTENTTLAGAGGVYLTVAAWTSGSLVLTALVVAMARLKPTAVLPALGGIAIGVYYWFAATGLAAAYGAGRAGVLPLRILALVLIVAWLRHALRRPAPGRTA